MQLAIPHRGSGKNCAQLKLIQSRRRSYDLGVFEGPLVMCGGVETMRAKGADYQLFGPDGEKGRAKVPWSLPAFIEKG
jgi:hypothetical protein